MSRFWKLSLLALVCCSILFIRGCCFDCGGYWDPPTHGFGEQCDDDFNCKKGLYCNYHLNQCQYFPFECVSDNECNGNGEHKYFCNEYYFCDLLSLICGDNILDEEHEECDDGNTEDGDGCSSSCRIEEKYQCDIIELRNQKKISQCYCAPGYQDSNSDGKCHKEQKCNDNAAPIYDQNGLAAGCECLPGYQDNDKDGFCQISCAALANTELHCGDFELCDDSKRITNCNCSVFLNANNEDNSTNNGTSWSLATPNLTKALWSLSIAQTSHPNEVCSLYMAAGQYSIDEKLILNNTNVYGGLDGSTDFSPLAADNSYSFVMFLDDSMTDYLSIDEIAEISHIRFLDANSDELDLIDNSI